jgi:hypothetical protein
MRFWVALLAPMLVWLAHFIGVYSAAEFAPTILPILVPILSSVALVILAVTVSKQKSDHRWQRTIVNGGSLVSLVAVVWQTLPLYL